VPGTDMYCPGYLQHVELFVVCLVWLVLRDSVQNQILIGGCLGGVEGLAVLRLAAVDLAMQRREVAAVPVYGLGCCCTASGMPGQAWVVVCVASHNGCDRSQSAGWLTD
jgi:hypothetical protein